MLTWRRCLAMLMAVLVLTPALPAGAAELKEGRDFRVIRPPIMADRTRIEVTEFFWYGCPHCFDFEPIVAEWVKKLPPDVTFRRVPAVLPNGRWAPGARLYYTLEAMNLLPRLHADAFNAIHVERKRLDDEKLILEWVATKGVDPKQFAETWHSFAVQSQMQQARATVLAAGVTGVPSVMVHGRYLVLTTGSWEDFLANVERLVDQVRVDARMK